MTPIPPHLPATTASCWQAVDWLDLSACRTPVLTWYGGAGREVLTGTNAARWVAKISNYLTELVGPGASVELDLPACWQRCVWEAAASLSDISLTCPADPTPDLVVTGEAASARDLIATDPGLLVLAHCLRPLAISWPGELPTGVMDALAEVSAQPDMFLSPPPAVHRVEGHQWLSSAGVLLDPQDAGVVGGICRGWTHGRPVVVAPTERWQKVGADEGLAAGA